MRERADRRALFERSLRVLTDGTKDGNRLTREQKITLGEMRASGVRGLLVYCAD